MPGSNKLSKRRCIAQRYSYKLPIYLVALMQHVGYSHKEFLDEFSRFNDLSKNRLNKRSSKVKILLLWTYYIWLLFVFAGLISFSFNFLSGIIVLIMTPFITASVVYILVYVHDTIRNPSLKRLLGYDFDLPSVKKKTKHRK